ncbi:MAG: MerR family transcriptional regulator [Clostridiales Family XIII bacterium]|jgi:DNA-binding transcriptional MerR regulator|nr:MerR family transcriptional regulator [Clostridiales Family XIII bacterium]
MHGAQEREETKLYLIGGVAELLGIPMRTIHYYEKIGLIRPYFTDPETRYRYYTIREIYLLDKIRQLGKDSNMPLKQISEYLDSKASAAELANILETQLSEVETKIEDLQDRKAFTKRKINALRNIPNEFNVVSVCDLPERTIHVTDVKAETTEQRFDAMLRILTSHGHRFEAAYYMVDHLNRKSFELDLKSSSLFGLNDIKSGENFHTITIPEGRYAKADYKVMSDGRNSALQSLKEYFEYENLTPAKKIVTTGNIFNAASVHIDDYYLTLELRIESRT